MRQVVSWPLVLILATLVHVDWHLARPVHHRLSLGWSSHWLFAIAVFAAAGWYIGRRLANRPWKATVWNVGLAIVIAQGVVPVLEVAFYDGRLGYSVDRERWTVFWECVATGLPALALVIWRVTPRLAPRA